MRTGLLLGFLLLLTLDTASQITMKLAADRLAGIDGLTAWLQGVTREPLIYLIAGMYTASFLTYVTLLKQAAVGPAYAAAHGHIVTVTLISVAVLGERLTLVQGIGAAAIVAGVALLALTEKPEVPGGSDQSGGAVR